MGMSLGRRGPLARATGQNLPNWFRTRTVHEGFLLLLLVIAPPQPSM